MAFSTNSGDSSGPMSEINVTPMVDVMLVLLIIFMITAPLMQHQIKPPLPEADTHQQVEDKMQPADLAITEDGSLYLNDAPITQEELRARLAVMAQQTPQPELQIRAAKTLEYRKLWSVMSTAKSVGMVHLGFITIGQGEEK